MVKVYRAPRRAALLAWTPLALFLSQYHFLAGRRTTMEPLRRTSSQASSMMSYMKEKQSRLMKRSNKSVPLGRSDDIIIAVMGPTGVGKSNFIEKLTGNTETKTPRLAGGGLASYTSEIDTIRIYGHPSFGNRIVLVDTPGFDDTHRSDMEILTLISNWLKSRYESGVLLSGLIYLHRISDNRMSGSPARNLRMFGKLCGEAAADRVAFITTMWDRAAGDENKMVVYKQRQLQLKKYWEPMTNFGAQIGTFSNSIESAWDAVSLLLKVSHVPVVNLSSPHNHITSMSFTSAEQNVLDDDTRSVSSRMSTLTVISRKIQGIMTMPILRPLRFVQCTAEYSEPLPNGHSTQHVERLDTEGLSNGAPNIDTESITQSRNTSHCTISLDFEPYSKNILPFPTHRSEPSSPTLGSPGELWLNMDRLLTMGNRSTLFIYPSVSVTNQATATLCSDPTINVGTARTYDSKPNHVHFAGPSTDAGVREPTSPPDSVSIYSPQGEDQFDATTTLVSSESRIEDVTLCDDSDTGFTLVDAPTTVLHVQSELVDERKKVYETDAAQTLYSTLQSLIHENRKNMHNLLKEKSENMDEKTRARVEEDIKILERQFQKSFEEMKRLQLPPLRRAFLRVCPSALLPRTRALDMGLS